jgi:hypothetical protein
MGCGENSYADVSPDKAVSEPFGGYDLPWMVLLQADPDVTASVELSVSPTGVPGAISPPGRR